MKKDGARCVAPSFFMLLLWVMVPLVGNGPAFVRGNPPAAPCALHSSSNVNTSRFLSAVNTSPNILRESVSPSYRIA